MVRHVVAEFNGLLRREEVEGEVVVAGLPEHKDFEKVRTQIRARQVSFADAIKTVDID